MKKKIIYYVSLITSLILLSLSIFSNFTYSPFNADNVKESISILSSDTYAGRLAGSKENSLVEELIRKNLYQDLPPLDFVIRTSGELRLSNFMMWQASYAEFYFPKVYFPDFNSLEFDKAIVEYNNRNRRFGGIKWQKE